MKLKEAIDFNKDSSLEESFVGNAVRAISGVAGVGLAYLSVTKGALATITGLSLTPVIFGVGGAVAAAAGVKFAFDAATKIEDRQLMRSIDRLAEVIAERDELIDAYDDETDSNKRSRMKDEIRQLTNRQVELGNEINNQIFDNPSLRENLSKDDYDMVKRVMDAAEDGSLTTLEIK